MSPSVGNFMVTPSHARLCQSCPGPYNPPMLLLTLLAYRLARRRTVSFEGWVIWCGYGVIGIAAELTLELWLCKSVTL
jgi:hypothetical protein